jgi:hypothetical protein
MPDVDRRLEGSPRPSERRAALVLVVASAAVLIGSSSDWAGCSTVGCDSALQAFGTRSGIEFGYGIATAASAAILVAIGIDAHHRGGASRLGSLAAVLSLVILGAIVAYVTAIYIVRDDSLTIWGLPAVGAVLTAAGGLVALAASIRIRTTQTRGTGAR